MDYAVEPFYYERGLNFYEDGQNYALASLLYRTGPTLFGKKGFEALLANFQMAIRKKLQLLLNSARNLDWKELPQLLGPLVYASSECLAAIATPGVTTDTAFVVLQSLISRMEVIAFGTY
ncbi:hypothetical protein [Methylotenera sp.]|uniref:hypothetical protein n=1 Tax=Methylotenera sp. TaxID=2051956 RepID=UPI002735C85D|nr:hypothetical protein [Methylotenera sp.]MDP3777633.1 hypothetical protein [Methylotenera sp.]